MILPTINQVWAPQAQSVAGPMYFVELLVHFHYELMVWLPSGYAQKVEVK